MENESNGNKYIKCKVKGAGTRRRQSAEMEQCLNNGLHVCSTLYLDGPGRFKLNSYQLQHCTTITFFFPKIKIKNYVFFNTLDSAQFLLNHDPNLF